MTICSAVVCTAGGTFAQQSSSCFWCAVLGKNLRLFSHYRYSAYIPGASEVPCPKEVVVAGLVGSVAGGWGKPSRGAGRRGEGRKHSQP